MYTSGQLTKNIYQLDKYFYRSVNSSLYCTFCCKHCNSITNGSKLIIWQTLCNCFWNTLYLKKTAGYPELDAHGHIHTIKPQL